VTDTQKKESRKPKRSRKERTLVGNSVLTNGEKGSWEGGAMGPAAIIGGGMKKTQKCQRGEGLIKL